MSGTNFFFNCGICGYAHSAEEPVEVIADALLHIREKHLALYAYRRDILNAVLNTVMKKQGFPNQSFK